MTHEEYVRQRKEEGDREWARLLVSKAPPNAELAAAIWEYGLEAGSDAAKYVATRIDEDLPERRGRPRNATPEAYVRWFYQCELHELQILKASQPAEYEEQHGTTAPHVVAAERAAEEFKAGQRRITKLKKK